MLRSRRIISAASKNVNGGSLLKIQERLLPIIPLSNPSQRTSARFLDVFELATKTAVERSRARVKDEMSRSYFQDIKDLEKHGGKVSKANKTLVPAASAIKFPTLEVNLPNGSKFKLPVTSDKNGADESASKMAKDSIFKLTTTPKTNDSNASTSDSPKVSLICLSFRASGKPMVDSWISPFLKAFGQSSDIQIYRVSFIDSWLLSRWPIKKLLLMSMRESNPEGNQNALKTPTAYSFGDNYYFRKELNIVNLLTGYLFLLDNLGRVRWQGNGPATEEELLSLLSCTSILLAEDELLSVLSSSPSAQLEKK